MSGQPAVAQAPLARSPQFSGHISSFQEIATIRGPSPFVRVANDECVFEGTECEVQCVTVTTVGTV